MTGDADAAIDRESDGSVMVPFIDTSSADDSDELRRWDRKWRLGSNSNGETAGFDASNDDTATAAAASVPLLQPFIRYVILPLCRNESVRLSVCLTPSVPFRSVPFLQLVGSSVLCCVGLA